MKRLLFVLMYALALAGCGSNSTTTAATAQAQTPESVNAAWVEALKANDRDALIRLASDLGSTDNQNIFVDTTLRQMRGMLDPSLTTGGLVSIQQFTPVTNGAERLGLSLWTFAKTKRCYQARMTAQDDQWKVISWNEKPNCPAS